MTSLVPAHAHCPPQLLWARNHHPEKKETRNSVANRMTHASAIATNLKRPRFMLLSADSFVYTFRRLQRRCSLPRMREKIYFIFAPSPESDTIRAALTRPLNSWAEQAATPPRCQRLRRCRCTGRIRTAGRPFRCPAACASFSHLRPRFGGP